MAAAKFKLTEKELHNIARLTGIELDETRTVLLLPTIERIIEGIGSLDDLELAESEPAASFRFEEES